jgi:hypothetical protein
MNAAISRIAEDERCTASHASLYYALFHCWNQAFFRNPLSISRNELMRQAGIGSTKTYYRCLHNLHDWEYISYLPSHNLLLGSKIRMIRFDRSGKSAKPRKGTPKDSLPDKTKKIKKGSSGTQVVTKRGSSGTQPVINRGSSGTQLVTPYINSKNITNKPNNTNAYEQADANSDLPIGEYRNTGHRKGNRKTGEGAEQPGKPENLDQVVSYFEEKKSTGAEAEKFFNYFESVGWRVGGRSLMRDWRAAARNWIANIPNYNTPRHDKNKVFKPQLTGKKNYAEPF